MAELATIARPYAEAAYEATAAGGAAAMADALDALAQVAANPDVRLLAGNPRVGAAQVAELFAAAVKSPLPEQAQRLLDLLIENGRLDALPQIAAQYRALKNAGEGQSEATVYSAFELSGAQLAELQALLEKKFGRKLVTHVQVDPGLIGGVRVVVGDQVLDTSVKARLEQMKVTLTA
jgi:F-type H+-transporting ATPase subunit delta